MKFKKDNVKRIGEYLGYVAMYLIFTAILYFILKYFNKAPQTWNYFHIMIITLFIVLASKLIKLALK